MLVLTRRDNQRLFIDTPAGDRIAIEVWRESGGKIKVSIDAPQQIKINREEVAPPAPVARTARPDSCPECRDSGYSVHPQNGKRVGKRCPRGCLVRCSVCSDANCTNPDGQH